MSTATTMKSAVIAFLICLLVFSAQGQSANRSRRCKCLNGFISGRIQRHHIKAGPVVHLPSVFCPHTEIIVTTMANKEKCVNPESQFGQRVLENHSRHEEKRAVSATTMTSSISTRLHTTSRL